MPRYIAEKHTDYNHIIYRGTGISEKRITMWLLIILYNKQTYKLNQLSYIYINFNEFAYTLSLSISAVPTDAMEALHTVCKQR